MMLKNLNILFIGVTILFISCSKQQTTPKPEYLKINRNGTIELENRAINYKELRSYLRNRIYKDGMNIPIYFTSHRNTPFFYIKKTILTVAGAGCYDFRFQLVGSPFAEKCCHDFIVSDGPKTIQLLAEINNDILYVNNKIMAFEEFNDLISKKPVDAYCYSVLVSCSDFSAYENVYKIIEISNKSEHADVEFSIMNDIVNKHLIIYL